jgi:hypothetical protein
MTLSKWLVVVFSSVFVTAFVSYFVWRPKPSLPVPVSANTCPVADNSQIMSELSFIKNQIAQITPLPTDKVMGVSDLLPENNLIALFTANAYDSPAFAGRVIGHVAAGKIYPWNDKSGEWYKVRLEATTSGWVANQYVKVIDSLDLP